MKSKINFVNLIKDILGENQYLELLKDIAMENVNSDVTFDKFFSKVANKYCFIILIIGFSKRVEVETYAIDNTNNVRIKPEVFAKKYEKYIKQVENMKFEFLKDII